VTWGEVFQGGTKKGAHPHVVVTANAFRDAKKVVLCPLSGESGHGVARLYRLLAEEPVLTKTCYPRPDELKSVPRSDLKKSSKFQSRGELGAANAATLRSLLRDYLGLSELPVDDAHERAKQVRPS